MPNGEVVSKPEAVNLEAEMTSLADEQLRYEATEKLLEKAYQQIRVSMRDK
jgi:flagellar basal body rod protein FlgB